MSRSAERPNRIRALRARGKLRRLRGPKCLGAKARKDVGKRARRERGANSRPRRGRTVGVVRLRAARSGARRVERRQPDSGGIFGKKRSKITQHNSRYVEFLVSGRFSDDFRLFVAARRLGAPEPLPMRPPFPSYRSFANGSPIGLAARRRVDDVNGRRRIVSERRAFAAAKRFQKP